MCSTWLLFSMKTFCVTPKYHCNISKTTTVQIPIFIICHMSYPPQPNSDLPPRYSQVVGRHSARYAFNDWQIFGVAHTPQHQYTVFQPYFPQPAPFPQAYGQIYPNIQYQAPYLPNTNSYQPPISNIHSYPPLVQYHQRPQDIIYPPQQGHHQSPGPVRFSAILDGQYGFQEPFDVPPPPEGFVLIPGTNIAVSKEWMTDDDEENDNRRQHFRNRLRGFKGKKRDILRKMALSCLYKLRDAL